MSEFLKIAIQKKGRLYDGSMALLKECGIDVSNGNNQLRVQASNFPVEVFFLRDDDIPEYVQDAVADIGIVGENVTAEKNKQVTTVEKLNFGNADYVLLCQKTVQ
jgi:ATP phosphoribosyltransferase